MSVVGSAVICGLPEGSFELGRQSVRIPYRVYVDSMNDGPYTVASASGLPVIGTYYTYGSEINRELIAKKYDPKPVLERPGGNAGLIAWTVEVVFESPNQKESRTDPAGRNAGGGTGRSTDGEFNNPLLEVPVVKWHASGRESLLTRIYDNTTGIFKPCTASNGEVFDPPPKFTESFHTLEITRNEPIGSPQPATAIAYDNAVNSDIFWGVAAGYWKIKEIVPERQDRQIPSSPFKFPFLRVSYSFEYNPNSWTTFLLDYGSYFWKRPENSPGAAVGNIPATKVKIRTSEGHETSAPLNGNGMPLPDRVPYTPSVAANANIAVPATSPLYQFNVGDIVQLTALPVAGAPINSIVAPGGLSFNQAYYIKANTVVAGAQTITLSATPGGADIAITSVGTGWHYIYSPGVFFQIQPYNRLPFGVLGLPQNFLLVQ